MVTQGRSRTELFRDETSRLELAAEAEPWLLARALEASSVGQAALETLEEAVGSSPARTGSLAFDPWVATTT